MQKTRGRKPILRGSWVNLENTEQVEWLIPKIQKNYPYIVSGSGDQLIENYIKQCKNNVISINDEKRFRLSWNKQSSRLEEKDLGLVNVKISKQTLQKLKLIAKENKTVIDEVIDELVIDPASVIKITRENLKDNYEKKKNKDSRNSMIARNIQSRSRDIKYVIKILKEYKESLKKTIEEKSLFQALLNHHKIETHNHAPEVAEEAIIISSNELSNNLDTLDKAILDLDSYIKNVFGKKVKKTRNDPRKQSVNLHDDVRSLTPNKVPK